MGFIWVWRRRTRSSRGAPSASTLNEGVELEGDRELVLNVRLRPDAPGGDAWVEAAVRDAGLLELANVFALQAYGFARERAWDTPFVVGTNFTLVNPDGTSHGADLVGRSEAMRALP